MDATLEAVSRNRFGKNEAGRIRREGQIPAVVYGEAHAAESVSVNPKDLLRILYSESGANTLISLKIDGKGDARVLVKEYQLHPTEQNLLHADFYRVAMDKVLRVTVPVHLTGVAKGIKEQGGIVDFVHREIVMECLPADIPEHITIDVTELMLHDGVRVRASKRIPEKDQVSRSPLSATGTGSSRRSSCLSTTPTAHPASWRSRRKSIRNRARPR